MSLFLKRTGNFCKQTILLVVKFLFASVVFFLILNLLIPLRLSISYSQQVLADDGTVLNAFLSSDEKWRMKIVPEEINAKFKKAILYKEDRYFYYHPGVNLFAVARAAFNNITKNRKTSGASTITMQVVRLLYPAKRNYINKIGESFRAVQMEMYYTKDEILQMYLNLVPYGGNIEGVKAASVMYFATPPDQLSLAQIVTLSIIPNRPVSLRMGRNNNVIVAERNRWLRQMQKDNIFSDEEIADAINEPLDSKRLMPPKEIPHLALRLRTLFPDSAIIHTSICRDKQNKALSLAYNYSRRLKQKNIYNTSVIVINNKTCKAEAYIGSSDFFDAMHAGQVDGVVAVRSPGSTLKPLVYAMAFDEGLMTPKTIIADVPVNYLGYSPENFNSKYNGNVTIEQALAGSLNIPAVKTLSYIGIIPFASRLQQAGFRQVEKDISKLGLSTVLGGCGVRLEELSSLYASIANNGEFRKIKYLKSDKDTAHIKIISAAAAYMTTDILSQLIRPDMPNNFASAMHIPRIAWKTGTSYGRRDAWSIGYNKNYTIGVWVGNFSGAGIAELTGADMATPLLFELFNAIDYNSFNEWFMEPEDLSFRLVCSESGKVPSGFCTATVQDYFIPSVSSNSRCMHLKEVMISSDKSVSYCTGCAPQSGYSKKLYPNPEPDLITWYENEHIAYEKTPVHNPLCTRVFSNNPPRITSPVNKKEYLVEKGLGEKLMLSCNTGTEVQTVYWYIDDVFFCSAVANETVFFTPHAGQTKISCADDKGRNSNLWITVSEL